MIEKLKVDWLEPEELIEFFGCEPVSEDELRQVFELESVSVGLHFDICQADRFASLTLCEKGAERKLFEIVLPNYAWLYLSKDPKDSMLVIGPPKSFDRVSAGGGVTVSPVILRVSPSVSITFDRQNDCLRRA